MANGDNVWVFCPYCKCGHGCIEQSNPEVYWCNAVSRSFTVAQSLEAIKNR